MTGSITTTRIRCRWNFLVGCCNERHQIVAGAHPRVDLQEVLHAVSMIGIQVAALLEDRAQPERCDAQVLQVGQFGLHALEGAALPSVCPGGGPSVPSPRRAVGETRTGCRQIVSIEQRAVGFLPVAEPVNKQKIKNLIAPVDGDG